MEDRIFSIKCLFFAQFLKTVDCHKQKYYKNRKIGLNFMCASYLPHSNLFNRGDPFHPMFLVEWMTDDYQIQPSFMCFYIISKFLLVTFFHWKWLKCLYPSFTFWEKKLSFSIKVQICQKWPVPPLTTLCNMFWKPWNKIK